MLHYLDDVRHGLSAMWAYQSWAGNISAGVIVSFFVSLLWPRARRHYKAWFEGHLKVLHEKMDTQHDERLLQAHSHHRAVMKQTEAHHEAQLAAIRAIKTVKLPVSEPIKPKAPVSPVRARKATSGTTTPRKAGK